MPSASAKATSSLAHAVRRRSRCRASLQSRSATLPASSASSIALTGPIDGRRHRQRPVADADQRHGAERIAGKLAAQRHRHLALGGCARSGAAPAGTAATAGRSGRRAACCRGRLAIMNCNRSLEPTETKSTALTSPSSCHSSEGTSIIAPSISRSGSAWPWRRRWASSRSIIARARVDLVDLGDHRQHDAAARGRRRRAAARGAACAAAPAGRAPMRIARQPMRRVLLVVRRM